jgi:hypothetical protein
VVSRIFGKIFCSSKKNFFSCADKNFLQNILTLITRAINDKPRKISYENLVDFLQTHLPPGYEDSYEFFEECFDSDGHLIKEAILYILFHVGVFQKKSGESVNISLENSGKKTDHNMLRKWSEIFNKNENSKKIPGEPPVRRQRAESTVVKATRSIGNFFKKILRRKKKK